MTDNRRTYLDCVDDDRTYLDCVDDNERTYLDCGDDNERTYLDCGDDTIVTPPSPAPTPYRNDDIWYKEIFYKVMKFISRLFGRLGF